MMSGSTWERTFQKAGFVYGVVLVLMGFGQLLVLELVGGVILVSLGLVSAFWGADGWYQREN